MSHLVRRLLAGAFAVLLAGSLGLATPAQAAGDGQFSETKLQAFADAAVAVSEVVQTGAPAVQKAQQSGDQQKAQKLANEVRTQARDAVRSTEGISLAEYKEISKAARQNKELKQKVTKMVQARRSAGDTQSN